MNDNVNKIKKLNYFKNFRIDKKLISFAKRDCIFSSLFTKRKRSRRKVFSSKQSKVWHQAVNRVHVQKIYITLLLWKIKVTVKGLSEFWFKYKMTEALSFSFLKPAKAILVPLIHLAGFIK